MAPIRAPVIVLRWLVAMWFAAWWPISCAKTRQTSSSFAAYSTTPRLMKIDPLAPAPALIERFADAVTCQLHTPTFISRHVCSAVGRMRARAERMISSTSASVSARRAGGPPAPCTSLCARLRWLSLTCGS